MSRQLRGKFNNVWPDMMIEGRPVSVHVGLARLSWCHWHLCEEGTNALVDWIPCWLLTAEQEKLKMKEKLLQRVCLWFCFAKGDSYSKCLRELTQVFGGSRMSERSVWRW